MFGVAPSYSRLIDGEVGKSAAMRASPGGQTAGLRQDKTRQENDVLPLSWENSRSETRQEEILSTLWGNRGKY